ncbi:50S ribosomal protein L17 [Candidatus Daviesbacteria bacterium]|nr:50S ribosomal protein L17 [Candidatus Daviesbacteria bacterium]
MYGKRLGRNRNEREALFKNLVRSLFLKEVIQTTEAKAKAIKGLVDKVINQAKNPKTKRLVNQFLSDKLTAKKLINEIAPRFKTRISGYTSTVKLGVRKGDGAMMVQISLVKDSVAVKIKDAKVVKNKAKKEAK